MWLLLYGSFALVRPPLLDDADALHAEAAREILLTHDWVTLHVNGIRFLEKAPLLYWSIAASFRIFGEHDWAARLPLALYALALFLSSSSSVGGSSLRRRPASMPRSHYDRERHLRLYAHSSSRCHPLPLAFACDVFFLEIAGRSLSIAGDRSGIRHLLRARRTDQRPGRRASFRWRSFSSISSLRGTFAISCAGIRLPAPSVSCRRGSLAHPRSVLEIHAMGNPVNDHPTPGQCARISLVLFHERAVRRYFDAGAPARFRLRAAVALLVTAVCLYCSMVHLRGKALARLRWQQIFRREDLDTGQRVLLLLTIWAVVVMVFFSFPSRQEYYVLPALPPLALLAGYWLAEDEIAPSSAGKRTAWVLFVARACSPPIASAALRHSLQAAADRNRCILSATRSQHAPSAVLWTLLRSDTTRPRSFRVPLCITTAALLSASLPIYGSGSKESPPRQLLPHWHGYSFSHRGASGAQYAFAGALVTDSRQRHQA